MINGPRTRYLSDTIPVPIVVMNPRTYLFHFALSAFDIRLRIGSKTHGGTDSKFALVPVKSNSAMTVGVKRAKE